MEGMSDFMRERFALYTQKTQPEFARTAIDRKLGSLLRALRLQHRISQREVATLLHLSRSAITNIEAGSESLKVRHLIILCAFFDIDPEYFLK